MAPLTAKDDYVTISREVLKTMLWIHDRLYEGCSWRAMEAERPEINVVLSRIEEAAGERDGP